MSYPPIALSDDPKEALLQIESYLSTMLINRHRAYHDATGELVGYWQTTEWLEGLKEIASECRRIGETKPPPQHPPMRAEEVV